MFDEELDELIKSIMRGILPTPFRAWYGQIFYGWPESITARQSFPRKWFARCGHEQHTATNLVPAILPPIGPPLTSLPSMSNMTHIPPLSKTVTPTQVTLMMQALVAEVAEVLVRLIWWTQWILAVISVVIALLVDWCRPNCQRFFN